MPRHTFWSLLYWNCLKIFWGSCLHFYFYGIVLLNVTIKTWRPFHCISMCMLTITIYQDRTQDYQFFSATSLPQRHLLTYVIKFPENRNISPFPPGLYVLFFFSCPHIFLSTQTQAGVLCLPSLYCHYWGVPHIALQPNLFWFFYNFGMFYGNWGSCASQHFPYVIYLVRCFYISHQPNKHK